MENIKTTVTVDGEVSLEAKEVKAQMLMAKTNEGIHGMIYGDRETVFDMVLDTIEHDSDFGTVIGLVCATIINAPDDAAPPAIIAIKKTIMATTIELAKEGGFE